MNVAILIVAVAAMALAAWLRAAGSAISRVPGPMPFVTQPTAFAGLARWPSCSRSAMG